MSATVRDCALMIDEEQRLVIWLVTLSPPHQHLCAPWGELWREDESGAGLVVRVKAREPFDLMMDYGPASYFESVPAGRHRFLLTLLDSTDVA